MKNIVLYVFIGVGMLLVHFPVSCQKPTIELLPTNHQLQHPEAMKDTMARRDSIEAWGPEVIPVHHPAEDSSPHHKKGEKRIRTGWHFDVFHLRMPSGHKVDQGSSDSRSERFRFVRPVQLMFQITALK